MIGLTYRSCSSDPGVTTSATSAISSGSKTLLSQSNAWACMKEVWLGRRSLIRFDRHSIQHGERIGRLDLQQPLEFRSDVHVPPGLGAPNQSATDEFRASRRVLRERGQSPTFGRRSSKRLHAR